MSSHPNTHYQTRSVDKVKCARLSVLMGFDYVELRSVSEAAGFRL